MKVLTILIGAERYGLRLAALSRVLPAAQLKQLPLAPAFVAGVLDFHGQPVPVIDLARLAGGAALAPCFDSRIILLDYPVDGGTRLLGLLAEHVTGVETVPDAAFGDCGVRAAPFLGQVAGTAAGMLQLIEPAQLLTADVRALLFQPAVPA
ncbi:MAG: chemotaxis protein CheW [Pseudomonadota bacterium]